MRGEVALGHEVAAELLRGGRGDAALRAVRLEAVRVFGRRDVQEKLVDAALARRARALGRRQARRARVNERRAIPVLIDLLEVDHELRRVVLGVCEDLGTKECDDVVGDDLHRLGLEVVVVDTQVGVEPVDLVCNKLARDEALWLRTNESVSVDQSKF